MTLLKCTAPIATKLQKTTPWNRWVLPPRGQDWHLNAAAELGCLAALWTGAQAVSETHVQAVSSCSLKLLCDSVMKRTALFIVIKSDKSGVWQMRL